MLNEGGLDCGQNQRSVASADARDQTCSSQIQVAGIMRYTSNPVAVPTKQNLVMFQKSWNWDRATKACFQIRGDRVTKACFQIKGDSALVFLLGQGFQSKCQTNACCPQVLVRQSFALCTLVSKGSPMKYSSADGNLLCSYGSPEAKPKIPLNSLDSDSRMTEKEPCITRFRSTSNTAKTVSNQPTSAKPRTRGMFQALSSNVTGVVLPSVRVVPTDLCKCGAIV